MFYQFVLCYKHHNLKYYEQIIFQILLVNLILNKLDAK